MLELKDSSAIAGQPGELKRRIREDGYLLFRGLLPAEPIRRLTRSVLAALQREGWLAGGHPPEEAQLQPPARDFKNSNFFGGYTALQGQEYFHALPHEPALTGVMKTLMGSDVFTHPRKVGRMVWPTRMGTTPGIYAHQDFVVEGVPDMFTSWIPFVDCPRDLGGLCVLTGSQNQGVVPRLNTVDADDDAWATTDYQVGDVLVFHCLTAHAALPNNTDRLRLSGDYRWQSTNAPVPADALLPHLHGPVPGWDELSRDWSSTTWVTPPENLTIVDRIGGEVTALPPSRYVTVPPQTPREAEHAVLAGVFNNMRDAFRPARAAGRRAVIDYRITSEAGEHRWQMVVADGTCQVQPGGDREPDVMINSGFRDYLRMLGGKLDPAAALATGALRLDGDVQVAIEQMQWFRD